MVGKELFPAYIQDQLVGQTSGFMSCANRLHGRACGSTCSYQDAVVKKCERRGQASEKDEIDSDSFFGVS